MQHKFSYFRFPIPFFYPVLSPDPFLAVILLCHLISLKINIYVYNQKEALTLGGVQNRTAFEAEKCQRYILIIPLGSKDAF